MTIPLLVDLGLLLLIVLNGLRGWRNGFFAGLLGLAGMRLGLSFALWGVPLVIASLDIFSGSELGRSLALIFAAVFGASFGRGLASGLGRRIARLRGGVGRIDGLLGVIAAVVATTLLAGVLGAGLKPVAPISWAKAMNESRVLGALEQALPGQSQRWASRLTNALDASGLPGAFSGLTREPFLPAEAPVSSDANFPGVRAAAASIVKVRTSACSRGFTGSGWVVAPKRIVTNAHVVAGASDVSVQVGGRGRALEARIVAFDPDLDLAILDVPTLSAPALKREPDLSPDAPVVVAGFPLGGPYRAEAARNRGEIAALGEDIYGRDRVDREVYSLYANAKPGNSGGPLLTTDGRVAGTVFAGSRIDSDTAYALTDAATDTLLDGALTYSKTVGAGSCTA